MKSTNLKSNEILFGYIKLGKLNATIAKQIKRKPADIYIDNSHLRHIRNKHQNQLGITDNAETLEYVRRLIKNFNMICEGNNGALLLICNQVKRVDIAIIELMPITQYGDIYQVKSAHIKDKSSIANKTLLWIK
ncbi:MAG: hypothetical protein LBO69_02765 [Ignavibacteria bacterium]|nr:hypothetical protein [Ignavibacteria bacterium]